MSKLRDAYIEMQKASGIEAGDTVRVLRMPISKNELGWDYSSFNPHGAHRKDMIGETGRVVEVHPHTGICVRPANDDREAWPFFCVELVEKGTPPLKFGSHTVEIKDGNLKVGCQIGSFAEVEAIYKEMLKQQ